MEARKLPALEVNLDAIRTNAQVLTGICAKNGIAVAGVIKFSDGDLKVAKAYADGGCAQLAVSRAKHLKALKEAFPEKETLLTRGPTRSDIDDTARYADLIERANNGESLISLAEEMLLFNCGTLAVRENSHMMPE